MPLSNLSSSHSKPRFKAPEIGFSDLIDTEGTLLLSLRKDWVFNVTSPPPPPLVNITINPLKQAQQLKAGQELEFVGGAGP